MKNRLVASALIGLILSAGMLAAQNGPASDKSLPEAAKLTTISVHLGKAGVSVEMTCSRPITPTPTMITDPSRLVLDFADTISAEPRSRISVNRDGLKSVRIGVQPVTPPTTRVVLDLDQARSYRLVPQGNKVTVAFGGEADSPTSSSATSNPDPATASNTSPDEESTTTSEISQPQPLNSAPAARSLSAAPGTIAGVAPQPSSDPQPSAAPEPSALAVQAQKLDPVPSFADVSVGPAPANAAVNGKPISESKQIMPAGPSTSGENGRSDSSDSSEGNAKAPSLSKNSSQAPGQKSSVASESPVDLKAAVPSSNSKPNVAPDPAQEGPASFTPPDPPPSPASAMATPDIPAATSKVAQAPQRSPDDYVIGEQDVLTIIVWKERELSGQVVVRPDGKITLPLVNEIKVVGMTPAQLQALLTEKFKPFLTVPQVTVEVNQINSRKVYLIGEVQKTGTFPINSSTTVLEVIAEAGGLRDFAKRKDVYILRNLQGKQMRYPFNYDDVIRGKKTQQNIVLRPGDLIVVP